MRMLIAGGTGLIGHRFAELLLYQVNIDVTRALLDGARAAGVHRFIHIGSPSMYFDRTGTLGREQRRTKLVILKTQHRAELFPEFSVAGARQA